MKTQPTRTLLATLLAIASCILATVGCGGGGAGLALGGGAGTLAIRLADAPAPGVTAVDVTITRIDAHIGSQWQTLATPNTTVNLLDLVTHDALLAQAPLPGGSYSQIRIFISSATVTDATGTHNVTIPSSAQTGIKINVDYTIQANTITDILLDFNVAQSLHITGNGTYMLQPVIPAVVKILSGTISGNVTSNGSPAAGASVVATYTAGSSYPLGTQVNSSTTLADGSFQVWALLPGTYDVSFSYTIPSTTTLQTALVSGVIVVAAADTNVGTVILNTPGSVSGSVLSAALPAAGASVTATYTAGGNLPNGTVAGSTSSAADGTFSIGNLPPGTYTLDFSYTVPATTTVQVASVPGVVVVAGADTPVGPITVV